MSSCQFGVNFTFSLFSSKNVFHMYLSFFLVVNFFLLFAPCCANFPQCGINKSILFCCCFGTGWDWRRLPCELAVAAPPTVKSADFQSRAHFFFLLLFFLMPIGSDVWEEGRLGAARSPSHASLQLVVFRRSLGSRHVEMSAGDYFSVRVPSQRPHPPFSVKSVEVLRSAAT